MLPFHSSCQVPNLVSPCPTTLPCPLLSFPTSLGQAPSFPPGPPSHTPQPPGLQTFLSYASPQGPRADLPLSCSVFSHGSPVPQGQNLDPGPSIEGPCTAWPCPPPQTQITLAVPAALNCMLSPTPAWLFPPPTPAPGFCLGQSPFQPFLSWLTSPYSGKMFLNELLGLDSHTALGD